jgi:flagellar basal body rod protein FlgC
MYKAYKFEVCNESHGDSVEISYEPKEELAVEEGYIEVTRGESTVHISVEELPDVIKSLQMLDGVL